MRTFAAPFEKRASEEVLKVHWKDWLLYKKQVPRNTIYREALILLKNYKCQDKLKIYKEYTMKSLILAQDER